MSLVLAYGAEVFSRDLGVDALVLGAYVLAGVVFALTDRRAAGGAEAATATSVRAALRSRTGLFAAAGLGAAVVLGIVAHLVVYDSIRAGRASVAGPVLWLLSLAVLVGTAVATPAVPTWPDAWPAGRLPRPVRVRRGFLAALALLFAAACAVRLIGLDRVPWGINADEGDRATAAISLLSGSVRWNVFSSGWFYISNVYFSLLAVVMKVLGVGFVQARVLGALSSVATLAAVVWIAFRHFGARMALLTAVIGTSLAVSLQFARETTEATPTALLWALSVAFFLEAARRGGTWPWIAAGISGGLSIYFYPTGRLWAFLAALVCLHVVARAGRSRRPTAIAGVLLAAVATLLATGPFFANARVFSDELFLRAQQTSVFSDDNASRLAYYNPHWNTLQLLWAQLRHSLAIFANAGDGGGFWPTDRPILGAALTVLVAVGIGWFSLSWRHTPRFVLALWFWTGFVGMVVTVETPDLQRMATAVPVLPLFAAGVLDATASRLSGWSAAAGARVGRAAAIALGAAAVAVAVAVAVSQGRFYFGTYADMYRWPQPTLQGQAVADQGRDALAMTIGDDYFHIASGWVQLLAPKVDKAGVKSPGADLPLAAPPTRDLAFVFFPPQEPYLPFLRSVYPGGSVHRYSYVTEGLVTTVYRVPRDRLARLSGSLAVPAAGSPVRVPALGSVPEGLRVPASIRWSAELVVPAYWDYRFRLSRGPARLEIDGTTVVALRPGRTSASAAVALAAGRHFVTLVGRAGAGSVGPLVEWRAPGSSDPYAPPGLAAWRPVSTADLLAAAAPHGLLSTFTGAWGTPRRRLDPAVAACCLSDEVPANGKPYTVRWAGSLQVPRTGRYAMALATQGAATLLIDGRKIVSTPAGPAVTERSFVRLEAGTHAVDMRYRVAGSSGSIEWTWSPPGSPESIVPPSALTPPPGGGVGPPVPVAALANAAAGPPASPLWAVP